MCIPHLFNKHSLALIIHYNTWEETSKHTAVDPTKLRKPLLGETALRPPAPKPLLGQGRKPHLVKELRVQRLRQTMNLRSYLTLKENPKFSKENNEQYYK